MKRRIRFYKKGYRKRRSAATTIARAWRRRNARKKGGLVARTALSNRRSIKRIKSNIEIKYLTKGVAQELNNWTGQVAVVAPDCIGCNNQLTGLTISNPNTQGQAPATFNFKPFIMRPLYCEQGNNEGQRIAEYINMKWINIKGSVASWHSSTNGTSPGGVSYAARNFRQKLRLFVVLDTAPVPWNSQLAPMAYQPNANPGYLYNMTNVPAAYGVNPIDQANCLDFLRDLVKSPFGSLDADLTCDPYATSYYENDHVQSKKFKKKRFKVLKTLTLSLQQPSNENTHLPNRKNFSITLKLPYKFQYANSNAKLPSNQEILIFASSTTKIPIGAGDNTPPVACPKLKIQCKVAFSDS